MPLPFVQIVNREIFENKWRRTFIEVTLKYDTPTKEVYVSDLENSEAFARDLVDKSHEFVQLIHFCGREAKALDFTLPSIEMIESEPKLLQTVLTMMTDQRVLITRCISRFKAHKSGAWLHGHIAWRSFSLHLRRRINALIEAVEMEEQSGNWVVDEKAERVVELATPVYEATREYWHEKDRASKMTIARRVFGPVSSSC